MFSGRRILVNVISQEHLEGISSNNANINLDSKLVRFWSSEVKIGVTSCPILINAISQECL